MTRKQLVSRMRKKSDLPIPLLDMAIDTFFETTKEILLSGHNITISNFGTFHLVTRKSRPGRYMDTMEEMVIPERCAVKFIPSLQFERELWPVKIKQPKHGNCDNVRNKNLLKHKKNK